MKKHSICYITYQTFPADTANSLQTISNISYLSRNNCNVSLVFPLREKQSTESLKELQNFYDFKEDIKIKGFSHNYPFGKTNLFPKIFFHISHYLWARKISKKISISNNFDSFITRSDWVFYFLLKQNKKVTFECHQLSKIRNIILKINLKNPNAKVIFLNNELRNFFSPIASENNSIVLHNGVDIIKFKNVKNKKQDIVFVGNLQRFNEDRGMKFLINSFNNSEIKNTYSLKIIGGPNNSAKKLNDYILDSFPKANIKITGRLDRKETIEIITKAEVGLMINNENNEHSLRYTSPLKYFEYLAGGLKIIGVDFPAHRNLPYSNFIYFFKSNNSNSLINAFNNIPNMKIASINKEQISLDYRAKKIINFISS